jgi:transposase-like protein
VLIFQDKILWDGEVGKTIRCPYCGFENSFKLLKTWRYKGWNFYYYECPKCNKRFRYQVDPTGRRKSHIIVKLGRRG